MRTLSALDLCLFLSLLVAIKLRFPLERAIPNFGRFTVLLVICTIMFDERMVLGLSSSAFFQSQKVISFVLSNTAVNNLAADKAHASDPKFRRFRRQLFHLSLSKIFGSLRPGMETPELARCPDSHLRQIIWGLGPYIADYPEQVLLACIVQGWCPM